MHIMKNKFQRSFVCAPCLCVSDPVKTDMHIMKNKFQRSILDVAMSSHDLLLRQSREHAWTWSGEGWVGA